MSRRHTRPERERLEMAITVTRTGVASVTAALIKLALFASASGAATMATTGDWRQMLRAAGFVALVALLLFGMLAFLAVLAWLGTRGERAEAEGWNFAPTGERTLTRLPEGVTELQLWRYLVGVANERVTLSQRGASEYDMTQQEANDVKEWITERGWIEITNETNGHWRWSDTGERVRDLLREQPPTDWNRVVMEVSDGR